MKGRKRKIRNTNKVKVKEMMVRRKMGIKKKKAMMTN